MCFVSISLLENPAAYNVLGGDVQAQTNLGVGDGLQQIAAVLVPTLSVQGLTRRPKVLPHVRASAVTASLPVAVDCFMSAADVPAATNA